MKPTKPPRKLVSCPDPSGVTCFNTDELFEQWTTSLCQVLEKTQKIERLISKVQAIGWVDQQFEPRLLAIGITVEELFTSFNRQYVSCFSTVINQLKQLSELTQYLQEQRNSLLEELNTSNNSIVDLVLHDKQFRDSSHVIMFCEELIKSPLDKDLFSQP